MNNPIKELQDLAIQLEAIAYWQQDGVQSETKTGILLCESAKWLRKASNNICAQGYFGCRSGTACTSEHK